MIDFDTAIGYHNHQNNFKDLVMFCFIADFNKIVFMEVLGTHREDAPAPQ